MRMPNTQLSGEGSMDLDRYKGWSATMVADELEKQIQYFNENPGSVDVKQKIFELTTVGVIMALHKRSVN